MSGILTEVALQRQLYLWPLCSDAWRAACELRQLPTDFRDYEVAVQSPDAELRWWNEQVEPGHVQIAGLFSRTDDHLVGTVKAFDFNSDHSICEIGIEILNPADYGQGLGQIGLALWLAYLKDQGVERVFGLIHPDNLRSRKLFHRLEFNETGIVKDAANPRMRFVRVEKVLG
ncbi:MAG: GNAT family N-acetyltransferase [Candidatus Sericytochromatia bacterium]